MTEPALNKTCRKCGVVKPVVEFSRQRATCKACIQVRKRAWNKRNPDKVKAMGQRTRAKNRERVAERNHAYYQAHRETQLAKTWARRAADPEKVREISRRVYRKNPERALMAVRKRRALLAGVEHEPWTRKQVWERGAGRCHICGSALPPATWHVDHVVPIAAGGPDTLSNLLPACPACNFKKGARWQATA